MSLSIIPTEVLEIIVSYIKPEKMLKLVLVSKTMCFAVMGYYRHEIFCQEDMHTSMTNAMDLTDAADVNELIKSTKAIAGRIQPRLSESPHKLCACILLAGHADRVDVLEQVKLHNRRVIYLCVLHGRPPYTTKYGGKKQGYITIALDESYAFSVLLGVCDAIRALKKKNNDKYYNFVSEELDGCYVSTKDRSKRRIITIAQSVINN